MIGYLGRRLAQLAPTLLGISVLAFALGHLAPGDPAYVAFVRLRGRQPSDAELERMREQLGLDAGLVEQFVSWIIGALQGDLGTSFATGRPVADELLSRLPATLQLASAGLLVAVAVAIPVGVVAALYRNRTVDHVLRVGAMFGASVPSYWLAYLLIIAFAVNLHVLPSGGRGGWTHLILPALALGLGDSAILARLTRSSLLDVLEENHVRTARAKGLPEWKVVGRHGLGNALNAVVTQAALSFGWLIAYSAIIEIIFVWPGIGRLALEAIQARDYPVIQGFVVLAGTLFVVINLVVDLLYVWLDPRVTYARPSTAVAEGVA